MEDFTWHNQDLFYLPKALLFFALNFIYSELLFITGERFSVPHNPMGYEENNENLTMFLKNV